VTDCWGSCQLMVVCEPMAYADITSSSRGFIELFEPSFAVIFVR
jgi:hypothetical protein